MRRGSRLLHFYRRTDARVSDGATRSRVIDGIRWRLRTGAPWRDVPERYGPWQTCYDRFVRWRQDGTWEMLLTRLLSEADASGELEWTVSVDSTVARAHQHSAGARRAPSKQD